MISVMWIKTTHCREGCQACQECRNQASDTRGTGLPPSDAVMLARSTLGTFLMQPETPSLLDRCLYFNRPAPKLAHIRVHSHIQRPPRHERSDPGQMNLSRGLQSVTRQQVHSLRSPAVVSCRTRQSVVVRAAKKGGEGQDDAKRKKWVVDRCNWHARITAWRGVACRMRTAPHCDAACAPCQVVRLHDESAQSKQVQPAVHPHAPTLTQQ
jgi:hypothetical protein